MYASLLLTAKIREIFQSLPQNLDPNNFTREKSRGMALNVISNLCFFLCAIVYDCLYFDTTARINCISNLSLLSFLWLSSQRGVHPSEVCIPLSDYLYDIVLTARWQLVFLTCFARFFLLAQILGCKIILLLRVLFLRCSRNI